MVSMPPYSVEFHERRGSYHVSRNQTLSFIAPSAALTWSTLKKRIWMPTSLPASEAYTASRSGPPDGGTHMSYPSNRSSRSCDA